MKPLTQDEMKEYQKDMAQFQAEEIEAIRNYPNLLEHVKKANRELVAIEKKYFDSLEDIKDLKDKIKYLKQEKWEIIHSLEERLNEIREDLDPINIRQ